MESCKSLTFDFKPVSISHNHVISKRRANARERRHLFTITRSFRQALKHWFEMLCGKKKEVKQTLSWSRVTSSKYLMFEHEAPNPSNCSGFFSASLSYVTLLSPNKHTPHLKVKITCWGTSCFYLLMEQSSSRGRHNKLERACAVQLHRHQCSKSHSPVCECQEGLGNICK